MNIVIDFEPYHLSLSVLSLSMVLGVIASILTFLLFSKKRKFVSKSPTSLIVSDSSIALSIFLPFFVLQPVLTVGLSYIPFFGDYMLVIEPIILSILFVLVSIFLKKANVFLGISTIFMGAMAYQILFRTGCFFSEIYIGNPYFYGIPVSTFFPVSFTESAPYFPISLIEIVFLLGLYLFFMIRRLKARTYARIPVFYLIVISVVIFVLEYYRSDTPSTMVWWLNIRQLVAFITLLIGALYTIVLSVFQDFIRQSFGEGYNYLGYLSERILNGGAQEKKEVEDLHKKRIRDKEILAKGLDRAIAIVDQMIYKANEEERKERERIAKENMISHSSKADKKTKQFSALKENTISQTQEMNPAVKENTQPETNGDEEEQTSIYEEMIDSVKQEDNKEEEEN